MRFNRANFVVKIVGRTVRSFAKAIMPSRRREVHPLSKEVVLKNSNMVGLTVDKPALKMRETRGIWLRLLLFLSLEPVPSQAKFGHLIYLISRGCWKASSFVCGLWSLWEKTARPSFKHLVWPAWTPHSGKLVQIAGQNLYSKEILSALFI